MQHYPEMNRHARHWLIPLAALGGLVAAFASPPAAAAAKNMMIIFGNNYSMNQVMGNNGFPSVGYLQFANTPPGCTGTNCVNKNPLYGDHQDSKIYIAKKELQSALDKLGTTNNINFGFANFRMRYKTISGIYAGNNNYASGTLYAKPDYGKFGELGTPNDWAEFSNNQWYAGNEHTTADKFARANTGTNVGNPLGTGDSLHDRFYGWYYNNTFHLGFWTYPTDLNTGKYEYCRAIYNPGTNQFSIELAGSGPISRWVGGYNYGQGTRHDIFKSEGMFGQPCSKTYPCAMPTFRLYCPHTNTPGYRDFPSFVQLMTNTYNQVFKGDTHSWYTTPFIYQNGLPFDAEFGYNGDQQRGTLTGWTGETTYTEKDSTKWLGTRSANFPSGPADPDADNRQLIRDYTIFEWEWDAGFTTRLPYTGGRWNDNKTQWTPSASTPYTKKRRLNHMGVFLDLPYDAATGIPVDYEDQRDIIATYLNTTQMNPNGLHYHPGMVFTATNVSPPTLETNSSLLTAAALRESKKISQGYTDKYGFANSTDYANQYQTPIYDSLEDALAYYTAYKAKDPFDACRENNILLILDSGESGHKDPTKTGDQFYNPADVARKLDALGVKTYVVMASDNQADIVAAHNIAKAGGTDQAYIVTSSAGFEAAFNTIFSKLPSLAARPAAPSRLSSGGMIYAAINEYDVQGKPSGHLKAYQLNKNTDGTYTSTFKWDAGDMGARHDTLITQRGSGLFSNAVGEAALTAFTTNASGLKNSDLAVTSEATAKTIKSYTIDPSFNNGASLNGRAPGSVLGIFSDISMEPVLMERPSNSMLMNQNSYRTYAYNHRSRVSSLLFQNDDGFLYAINPANNTEGGDLRWAWMPPQHLKRLQYTDFWSKGRMKGGLTVTESGNDSGYHTYVVGTAEGGALHYALRLDDDDTGKSPPARYAWITDTAGQTSPFFQPPVISYHLDASKNYTAYANYVTQSDTGSTFHVRPVLDDAADTTLCLSTTGSGSCIANPFIPTSTLTISQTASHSTSGLDVDKIYLGAKDGKVYFTDSKTSATSLSFTSLGQTTLDSTDTKFEPVLYLDLYSDATGTYLWAAGDKGVTVFKRKRTANNKGEFTDKWERNWMVSTTAAYKWDDAGNATSNPCASTVTTSCINQLPSNLHLTAKPVVVNGMLILPVSTEIGACGVGETDAYYYYYDLRHQGGGFINPSTGLVLPRFDLGQGSAIRPIIFYDSTGQAVVIGVSSTSDPLTDRTLIPIKTPKANPSVSWREKIN